jgi:hypothetical protein
MAVRRIFCGECEGKQREKLHEADHSDDKGGLRGRHRLSGDLVHLPCNDDRLRTGSQRAERAPG